ncbi:MAG: hypothetical protein R2706_15945 [Acidimicrobiales bacterium]
MWAVNMGAMNARFRTALPATLLACALVFLSACAELGEPDLGAAPGDVAQPAIDIADAPAKAEGDASTVSTIPAFMPERPSGYVPELLVSSADSVGLLTAGTIKPLTFAAVDTGATLALDDFFGGVVIDAPGGGTLWFAEESDAGITIGDGGDRLLDVGFSGSSVALFATSPREIVSYDLVSGNREAFATFADTESVLDLTSGGGLFVVALADEACGQLAFRNSSGEPVSLRAPQVSDCPVLKLPSFTHVATTPSGDFYAYTQVSYRSDGVIELTEAVVTETATGSTIRFPIAGVSEEVTSLTFDGTRIGFTRETERPTEVVVIDIAKPDQPKVVVAPDAAAVRFARIPLRVGGVNE